MVDAIYLQLSVPQLHVYDTILAKISLIMTC